MCDCCPTSEEYSMKDKIRFKFRDIVHKLKYDYTDFKNKEFLKECLNSDSSIIKHAINEFKIAGWMNDKGEFDDEWQELICIDVLELLYKFSEQGHSGISANYAINLFKEMSSFGIIKPLTGEDDEWNEIESGEYQNKRCSHVFKSKDGYTYDIEGRIFSENENKNNTFTCNASHTFVKFPYRPKREYVHLDGELTVELRKQYVQQELAKWEEYKRELQENEKLEEFRREQK